MKLILAIVSNDDSGAVSSALTRGGFSVTKLATTGGFLMAGNTTFISGVEDEKVDEVIGIIAKHSRRRTQVVPSTSTMDVGMYSSFPVEVTVGGSTIFVLNVDGFLKFYCCLMVWRLWRLSTGGFRGRFRAAGCRILFFYRVKRGLANAHWRRFWPARRSAHAKTAI